MLNVNRSMRGLRNSLVAKKLAEEKASQQQKNMTEFDKLRLKYNRSAIVGSHFPVSGYRYPKRGLCKKLNPLYKTSSMNYGFKVPNQNEIALKYFPVNNNFTDQFVGSGMY